jgi:diguanylate cyclase (GGDEF)-like protein
MIEYLSKQSKLFLITLGLLLIISVGATDYLTGAETSFGVFYLFPISIVTWFVGRWTGIVISSASAITWLIDDLMVGALNHHFIRYWNAIMIFGFFSIFTYVLSSLKNKVEREKKLARIDAMTGVANGRCFYELANIELSRASRYRHPFTVAYMDIDNFKFVNDRFGHSTGDSLLRAVAETIRNDIRESDIIARLGGDEFAILMPETGYESARIIITRVQQRLLDVMQKKGWAVTFSLGVITFTIPPNSIDEMVKKTDELMYSVKNQGKNSTRHEIFPERRVIEQVRDINSQSFNP